MEESEENKERRLRRRLREALSADERSRFQTAYETLIETLREKQSRRFKEAREQLRALLLELEQLYFLYYSNTILAYERATAVQGRRSRAARVRGVEVVEQAREARDQAEEEYNAVAAYLEIFDILYAGMRLREQEHRMREEEEEEAGSRSKRRREREAPVLEAIDAELCLYPAEGDQQQMVRFIPVSDLHSITLAEKLSVLEGFMPIVTTERLARFPRTQYALCKDVEPNEPVMKYTTIVLQTLFSERLTSHERFCAIFELIVSLHKASRTLGFRLNDSGGWERHLKYRQIDNNESRQYNTTKQGKLTLCHSKKRVVICDYRQATLDPTNKSIYLAGDDLETIRQMMRRFPVTNVTHKVLAWLTEQPAPQLLFGDLFRELSLAHEERFFSF